MIKGFKDLQDFSLPFNPVYPSAGVFRDRPVDLSYVSGEFGQIGNRIDNLSNLRYNLAYDNKDSLS